MTAHAHAYLKHLAVGLLGCASFLTSNSAAAQEAGKSRNARAELLSNQGQALFERGDVQAACFKFEAAEALEISAVTLLRLGNCYQRAGRSASAWRTFLEAAGVARMKKDAENAQLAGQHAAELEPLLTRIGFVVPMTSRVPGLTVRLGANTVPPTEWGTLIPVDPGVQRVSASAKGYEPWSVEIDTARAESRRYIINVPTLAPARDERDAAARGNAYRTAGVVTGSVGLAGIGAGAVFSALSRNPDNASTCVKGVVQCAPNKSNSLVYTDAATVSFAVGGALLATGVTLFVLAPAPDNKEKNSLRVAARYAGGGGRLQLEGVW